MMTDNDTPEKTANAHCVLLRAELNPQSFVRQADEKRQAAEALVAVLEKKLNETASLADAEKSRADEESARSDEARARVKAAEALVAVLEKKLNETASLADAEKSRADKESARSDEARARTQTAQASADTAAWWR